MIRVGFLFSYDSSWLGGINYFRNLLTSVYEFPERKIEAVIFTGYQTQIKYLEGFPDIYVIHNRIFDRGSLPWLLRKLWLRIFSYDLFLEQLLKRHNITVLSHSGWIGKNSTIPTIGWIPDFQHVHLPNYFSSKEIKQRNYVFHNICHFCSKVIVSSYDSQSDLSRFEPDCKRKSVVLQFVVALTDPKTILSNRTELEKRYKITEKYFLLPNQFWKHKNHNVVIEALEILHREGKNVLVIATGNTEDYRHPHYFASLMKKVGEHGMLDNFIPLGLVPVEDLKTLMRYAIGIINPSFFEGWSTTVEEAKSLGKHVILSDIPVHREQAPHGATYFLPDNANTLATILWEAWNKPDSDELKEIQRAQHITSERRLEFARNYQNIVLDVVGGS